MPFTFTLPDEFGGRRYTHLDFTAREIIELEERLKVEWSFINPVRSMRHGLAMLALLIGRTRDTIEVEQFLDRVTVGEIQEIIGWSTEDGLPTEFTDGMPNPKAADTGSTDGSSGQRNDTAGRLM